MIQKLTKVSFDRIRIALVPILALVEYNSSMCHQRVRCTYASSPEVVLKRHWSVVRRVWYSCHSNENLNTLVDMPCWALGKVPIENHQSTDKLYRGRVDSVEMLAAVGPDVADCT